MDGAANVIPASPETAGQQIAGKQPALSERPRKMRSLRAAVTILFAAVAFILPAVGTASASSTTASPVAPATATPNDTPWY
jgi:hypothetical protein